MKNDLQTFYILISSNNFGGTILPVRIESQEKGRPEFFWNLSSSRYSFQYTMYVHKILKNLFFSKIYSKGRKGVGKPRLLTLLHSSEKK